VLAKDFSILGLIREENGMMLLNFLTILTSSIFAQVIGDSTIDKIIIAILLLLFGFTVLSLGKIRKMNQELQKRNETIKQQALEIARNKQQLEEKDKELQKLDEERSNIIGVVSHDLKAPLNRIFALSNLVYLAGENLTNEQKDYLEKMNQVVRDGLDMIRNLLDIRAIEYKGIEMLKEEIDIDNQVQQMVKSYKSYTQQKEQKIRYKNETGDEHVVLETDRMYLNRILDNLLSNAVKFSPKGSEIVVELSKNEDSVGIKIIDNGPGISIEDQKKMFQKYRVLSAQPTGGESSTGLGLSITRSLVNILDGSIRYKSNPEGGSIFIVELPVLAHA
jgi:signal transduction histidine kinase